MTCGAEDRARNWRGSGEELARSAAGDLWWDKLGFLGFPEAVKEYAALCRVCTPCTLHCRHPSTAQHGATWRNFRLQCAIFMVQ